MLLAASFCAISEESPSTTTNSFWPGKMINEDKGPAATNGISRSHKFNMSMTLPNQPLIKIT